MQTLRGFTPTFAVHAHRAHMRVTAYNWLMRYTPFDTITRHVHSHCVARVFSQSAEGKTGLFEWQDGVVVKAMQEGCCLLVDEISLADDAVLERLNSVLETERRLLVSE